MISKTEQDTFKRSDETSKEMLKMFIDIVPTAMNMLDRHIRRWFNRTQIS